MTTVQGTVRTLPVALTIVVILLGCGRSETFGNGDGRSSNLTPASQQHVVRIVRAIDSGDTAALRGLLEAGAKPTPAGSPLSPIHAALTHFQVPHLVCEADILRLLLAHGADPNFIDPQTKLSPLEEALSMGNLECIKLLKDAGADPGKPGLTGQSIMQFAVKGVILTRNAELLSLVISWGVDPDMRSQGRAWTALLEAAATPDGEVAAEELLKLGADPCVKDATGMTALDLARVAREPSQRLVNRLAQVTQQRCSQRG